MKRIGTFLLALMLALAVPAPCFAAVDEKTVEAPSAVLVSAQGLCSLRRMPTTGAPRRRSLS